MTDPRPPLTITVTAADPDVVHLHLSGDLDYETADELQQVAVAQIGQHPLLRELRIDCAAAGAVDSMGLSVLLMIQRRTEDAQVRLRLDNRPANLDRILRLTGTFRHLVGDEPQEPR